MNPPAIYALRTRWAVDRDLPQVLDIETASFKFNDAWTENQFRDVLRNRTCIMFVATRGDAVVGFAVYQLHPDRLELLSLAVAPSARRTGVGAALLAKLRYKVTSHHRQYLAATVRETNVGALCFFRSAGLRAVKLLRGEYDDGDGVRMIYVPPAEESGPIGAAHEDRTANLLNGEGA